MAGSAKRSRSSRPAASAPALAARVTAALRPLVRPADRLVLGLSGGVDSVVLLDCLQHAARALRFRLSALHVHHGLQPGADRWAAFCRRLCSRRGVPFRAVRVTVGRGAGPEAEARRARYAEYARLDCEFVALAHHLDDQVETFLLQLLRGAGLKGLAAMPVLREAAPAKEGAAAPKLLRPLLDTTREEILAYARARRLRWIEDTSNVERHYARNFLRHEILPRLGERFPGYRAAIARAARHAAEAGELLDELAAADGAACVRGASLAVSGLKRFSPARARNLLRHFLATHGVAAPPAARLEEALRQLVSARADARPVIELGGVLLRRYRGRIHLVKREGQGAFTPRVWRGEAAIDLPELGGRLTMRPTRGCGISRRRLSGKAVTIRVREGGERLQPDPRRPRRTLKNLFQEATIAPWQRARLPLLFHGRDLVWVPGIGVDAAFRARKGEPGLEPKWVPTRA